MALCSCSQDWPWTPDCPASTCWVLIWHVPSTMPAIKSSFNSGTVSFELLALLKILMNYFKFSIPSPWNPAHISYPQYSSAQMIYIPSSHTHLQFFPLYLSLSFCGNGQVVISLMDSYISPVFPLWILLGQCSIFQHQASHMVIFPRTSWVSNHLWLLWTWSRLRKKNQKPWHKKK